MGEDEPFAAEDEYLAYLEEERARYAWVMRTYGAMSPAEADAEAASFYYYEPPGPYRGLVFHDEAWHWAMLRVKGQGYVTAFPDLIDPPAEYRAISVCKTPPMPHETEYLLHPIGTVHGGRDEWVEDDWYGVTATIRLDPARFDPGVVQGLDEFSHLEVVFVFDRVDPAKIRTDPRPPRGNPEWPPVGVFAGHGPFRPNRLGVSRCRLLGVDGLELRVADLDALDGTPVLDVKPYMREFDPVDPVTQPPWSVELMRGYYRAEIQ